MRPNNNKIIFDIYSCAPNTSTTKFSHFDLFKYILKIFSDLFRQFCAPSNNKKILLIFIHALLIVLTTQTTNFNYFDLFKNI